MNTRVVVREHGSLGVATGPASLDYATVTPSAFAYFCVLAEGFNKAGARVLQRDGQQRLKLDNYVGVLQSPCGTVVEVLPKHHAGAGCAVTGRALLRKMILADLEATPREAGVASLELFDAPLHEWVMARFLDELDRLLKRGLRFDYQRVDDELPFLRGQLDMRRQLRQPPGRQHRFQVRHDLYLPDRPENRLLRAALERVLRATAVPASWRLAQELALRTAEIRPSARVEADFDAWQEDRLMAHYAPIKPWCELVLGRQMPWALAGAQVGISPMFPMEKLFERFVAKWLRKAVVPRSEVKTPARSEWLCRHEGSPVFRLEPDLMVQLDGQRWVMDTKWKGVDAADLAGRYGLSQADFYQLFAYGQRYLGGVGEMALIYPRTATFQVPLPPFDFGGGLRLHVLPFDLNQEQLFGLEALALPTRSAHFPVAMAG